MEEVLLTVKNLDAWYNKEKMVLSDFSFELTEREAAELKILFPEIHGGTAKTDTI